VRKEQEEEERKAKELLANEIRAQAALTASPPSSPTSPSLTFESPSFIPEPQSTRASESEAASTVNRTSKLLGDSDTTALAAMSIAPLPTSFIALYSFKKSDSDEVSFKVRVLFQVLRNHACALIIFL
jgi:hypothetical protein